MLISSYEVLGCIVGRILCKYEAVGEFKSGFAGFLYLMRVVYRSVEVCCVVLGFICKNEKFDRIRKYYGLIGWIINVIVYYLCFSDMKNKSLTKIAN